jgi:xanthine dehydrogenase accessory factor
MTSTAISPLCAAPCRVLVLGGGDIGSAVAHRLFREGFRVVLSERPRSPHARRGMAFTDALFDGIATLQGVQACCVPDSYAVEACWREAAAIPMVSFPENLLLAEISFDVCVEATMRRHAVPADIRSMAPLAIGLGPGYRPGINCHVAIETQWGSRMGEVLQDQPAAPRSGGPRALAGVTRARFAVSPGAGIWRTTFQLGDKIDAGVPVGMVEDVEIRSPLAGHLRGLTRDGAQVKAGARVVEVDPRSPPQIFGLGERPLAIAAGVMRALQPESARAGASS